MDSGWESVSNYVTVFEVGGELQEALGGSGVGMGSTGTHREPGCPVRCVCV